MVPGSMVPDEQECCAGKQISSSVPFLLSPARGTRLHHNCFLRRISFIRSAGYGMCNLYPQLEYISSMDPGTRLQHLLCRITGYLQDPTGNILPRRLPARGHDFLRLQFSYKSHHLASSICQHLHPRNQGALIQSTIKWHANNPLLDP